MRVVVFGTSHTTRSFLLSSKERSVEPIAWREGRVRLLDQTRLPQQETYVDIDDCSALAEAIRALRIRGAPALGLAGAYGLALAALRGPDDREALLTHLGEAAELLAATRPTAVNLSWALQRVLAAARDAGDAASARDAVIQEALLIHE